MQEPSTMPDSTFEQLKQQVAESGVEATLATLAERLREESEYFKLFDARLMLARHRLGLPVVGGTSIDELPEPTRSKLEDAYLEVCREVGGLLLDNGRFRDAWMYLRPVGDRALVAEALAKAEPSEENLDELIEVALHEGIAPQRGFQLVLENYGTCNAITTFEGTIPHQPMEAQKQAAEMLVRHLHEELLENVRAHVEDVTGEKVADKSLAELVSAHEAIFENEGYHIDTSHLSSTVRFARLVDTPDVIELALELTEYGRRLSEQFQYEGEEPFTDMYPSHALLFAATLGRNIDQAVEYFRSRAESVDAEEDGTAAVETYLILLHRLGRDAEALQASADLVPAGAQLSHYTPQMIELARATGDFDHYLEICKTRDDVLGYAAGLVEAQGSAK